ncbi:hypothetical protein O181_034421 [Austropuccinia psidii MF-1]|uniref:Vacuolar membrane-associated protein IML1 n=1 Tax=Austropuccinia psidii MF-1 TaxID=1389203 RepID=A0A9Q3D6B5_9BASI|nr:hypothetical protein [Austropuccinia psidii MF-1]
MNKNSAECFRLTLWIDPEPPPPPVLVSFPQATGFDLTDAANCIRLNSAAIEPSTVAPGDLLEIVPLLNPVQSIQGDSFATAPRWNHEPGFMFIVRQHTLVSQQGLQISIPIVIAKAFDLERFNRNEVLLRKIPAPPPSSYCVDHMELFFRDQCLGPGEMWRMSVRMIDSCGWVGREVSLGALKVKTKVGRLYIKGKRALSGYITPFTKLIFRSESAKYYLFIQISSEMWLFEEDGSMYHEKALLFLEELFNRWEKIGAGHLLSLVLFSRVFYTNQEKDEIPPPVLTFEDGRAYKDFYKVVVDLQPLGRPQKVLDDVREEIVNFQKRVFTYPNCHGQEKLAGTLSYAAEGNILEAMGISCNSLDEHYIDPDLRRTGVSIVFLTAGTCVYHVNQMLLRLTTERFIAHGIRVNYVSLAKIPLHAVPLFRFSAADPEHCAVHDKVTTTRTTDPFLNPIYFDPPSPKSVKCLHYSVPFFVECSFFSRHQDLPFRIHRFRPRCRMPEIENEIGYDLTGISLPFLSERLPSSATSDDPEARKLARQFHDAQVMDAPISTYTLPKASKDLNNLSSFRTVVDGLAVATIETKRVPSTKYEESNRSPLLKATVPQGSMDFLQLANQSSAGLSVPPILSSDISRGRTLSSTTPLNSVKSSTPALITRLTNLSQPQRSIWPWSSGTNPSTVKKEAYAPNRSCSPPGVLRSSSSGEPNTAKAAGASTWTGIRGSKGQVTRTRRSDTIHSATNLMPFISPCTRMPSSSSMQRDIASADSNPPNSSRRKLRSFPAIKKFNPSNANCNAFDLSQYRRWNALCPRSGNDRRYMKWKSLTTPACLPITTDFSPSQEELNESYLLAEYEFPINDSSFLVKSTITSCNAEESMRNHAASTLREAVSQRIGQSFQIVTPELPTHLTELAPSARPRRLSLVGIVQEAEKGQGAHVDLSLSDYYHRLSIRGLESGKPKLFVQIYTRHRNWKTDSYICRSVICWPNEVPCWHEFETKLEFPHPDSVNFKTLDKMVVGLDEEILFNDHLRYWRTRAVFLPSPTTHNLSDSESSSKCKTVLSDDQNRLAGMLKLQITLRHVKWRSSSDSGILGPTLNFTTSDVSQHVRYEYERSSFVASLSQDQRDKIGRILNLRDPLNVIVEAMLHPSCGVDVKSQLIQLKLMENVFQGDKFVSFLKNQFDFKTRVEALDFGRQLEARGMFKEATNSSQPRQLIDGIRHYQLNPEYFPAKSARTWFGWANMSEDKKRCSSASRMQWERLIVNMTRVGIIDLDPIGKSDRSEKAILHCDISHSPMNAWHIEIQWLGITPVLVDGLLQHWARIVERYGIKMVEQSTRSLTELAEHNPLYKTVRIELAQRPPQLNELEELVPASASPNCYFEGQFLRSQGFVLDVEAERNFPNDVNVMYSYRRQSFEYSQFIHSSGLVIVQVQEGCFVWADNLAGRINSNRRFLGDGGSGLNTSIAIDTIQLKDSFTRICKNKDFLKDFWDECLMKLSKK